MQYDSFPYVRFTYLFLIGASFVVSMILTPLWGRRKEHPQIPWLLALSLTLGASGWVSLQSLSITDMSMMMDNIILRQRISYLAITLLCGILSVHFSGRVKKLFQAIPLLFVISIGIAISGNLPFEPLQIKEVTFSWGEAIFVLEYKAHLPTQVGFLAMGLTMCCGIFFSIIIWKKTREKKYLWLNFSLLGPLVASSFAIGFAQSGYPVTPLSNFTILALMLVPIFSELAKSDQLSNELKLREGILNGMAQQNPSILFSVVHSPDGSHKFLFLSEKTMDILGFPANVDDPIAELAKGFTTADMNRLKEVDASLSSSLAPWNFLKQYTRPDGRKIWLQGISNRAAHTMGIISNGVILDVSEHISQEKEREKLLTEVSLRKTELETMLYTLSHDMRSPLVNIAGFASEAKALIENSKQCPDEVRKESSECLGILLQNSEKLAKVISALLDIGRHSRDNLNITTLDTNAIWDKECTAYTSTSFNVYLHKDYPIPHCLADEQRLRIVFDKIIENCICYRKPDSDVNIWINHAIIDNSVSISILDDGIGIEPQYIDYCFGAFAQLKKDPNHQGMGLTLSRLLLMRMNGTITLTGTPNKGAMATVTLPIPT